MLLALPWAPHSGWMLCDIFFADGRPMPLDTAPRLPAEPRRAGGPRLRLLRRLEVEFHLFKLDRAKLDPRVPRSLAEALAAPRDNKALRAGFGDFFVDY
ncbi:MAG: hypothetical protein ACOY4R_15100 [Pseudomonadota bacterium]